jgi:hypothetical protein
MFERGTPIAARALIGADHDVEMGMVDLVHVERYDFKDEVK